MISHSLLLDDLMSFTETELVVPLQKQVREGGPWSGPTYLPAEVVSLGLGMERTAGAVAAGLEQVEFIGVAGRGQEHGQRSGAPADGGRLCLGVWRCTRSPCLRQLPLKKLGLAYKPFL